MQERARKSDTPLTRPVRKTFRVPDGYVMVPKSALGWLFGEATDANGQWFHESEPDDSHRRPYWWRSHLRKLIALPPQKQGDR